MSPELFLSLFGKYPNGKIKGVQTSRGNIKGNLMKAIQENWFDAKATIGFFPANSSEDDIILHNKKFNLYNLR